MPTSAAQLKYGGLVLSVIFQKTQLILQFHRREKQTKDMTSTNVIVLLKIKMSPGVRKPKIWILTRYDTNQAVELMEMARGLKFSI